MIIAIAARKSACVVVVDDFPPRMPVLTRTNRSTAMNSDFSAALFHDGGLRGRCPRAADLSAALSSSAVGLRPVRPRVSIEPAALPRCFVRLLRFVWAMWTYEGR